MPNPVFEHNARFLKISFDRKLLSRWADELFEWLFCIHPAYGDENTFNYKEIELKERLTDFIDQTNQCNVSAEVFIEPFFEKLPHIHALLRDDLKAFYHSDPAAASIDEVLYAYPGFFAISIHRLAHELFKMKAPIIPRLLSEYSHSKTGIDIHPGASIGERFLIDHGTGVVIGETCEIGNDVIIYQGVTLGALSVTRESAETKRHPTIGNRVIIYANATILGGKTVIGNDTVIGGNVWITRSVPANSLVFHRSETVIKNNSTFTEPLNFVI
ncbi:MAG: serine acetyltransferase [Lentimicrobium sp.]|nr:serine acetyltransferase [Lentimicrobium sp.]